MTTAQERQALLNWSKTNNIDSIGGKVVDNSYNLDLLILPNELRLLLEIMKIENGNSIGEIKSELTKDINWEYFLDLARHHRVHPLIYSKLNSIDESLVPSHIIQILYQEYKQNTFQMLHLSGEMEQVSKLFTENQIRLLFLKGPVIAADIYGDISLRTSKDLDILISKTDLKKAEELLLNYGYEREEASVTLGEWKWRKHHIAYFHPEKRIQIELHWRLHQPPMRESSFNELWERKRRSKLTSYPVYFLGKEDLFLFLIDHGNRHGWFRLRWLADIDQIIRKSIISEKNNELSKKYHQLGGKALILAAHLLNTPINEDMQLFILGKRSRKLVELALYYFVEMGNSYNNHFQDVLEINDKLHLFSVKSSLPKTFPIHFYKLSMMSNVNRYIYVIRLFNPSNMDMQFLRLPKPLYFLYFPLRPFLWIWRKTRKPV
ncbi:nucleotidyltransferase family protein [Peribacillus sp. NPDC096379]|uniref:nucleotidyltransferase domain-containing protein n=1 Tax=Peribacillus sp. NPDC096379 TaxID=3364393 RepID=UPI0038204D29